jgi:hypothetical protein
MNLNIKDSKEGKQEIHKERDVKKKEKDLKYVEYFNKAIEYKRLKHKNLSNTEINEHLNKNINKKNEDYLKFVNFEQEYFSFDSSDYPGHLFLSNDIREFYNLKSDQELYKMINDPKNVECRNEFLLKSKDKGETYVNLKNRLIDKKILKELIKERDELLSGFEELFKIILSSSHYSIFKICETLLLEYDNAKVKTAKIKQKLYLLKKNLEILESGAGIGVSKYFSLFWELHVLVDLKKSKRCKIENVEYDLKIERLLKLKHDIISEETFVNKNIVELRQNLVKFLLNDTKLDLNYIQEGKYFKKWSLLSEIEKKERIESYCHYFILNKKYNLDKFMEELKEENCLTRNVEPDGILIENLNTFLQKLFIEKKIKYREIYWEEKKGAIKFIRNINIIPILNEKKDMIHLKFSLKEPEFVAPINNVASIKKSKSKSLLMDKKKMEIINEYLLNYIINRVQYNENEISEEDYLLKLKNKLGINRIINADKENIIKNFKEMYIIVKEEYNKLNENEI